jgi:protease I
MSKLKERKVAILATDGFEYSELIEPKKALEDAGATTEIVSPGGGKIRGWSGNDWADAVDSDRQLAAADASDYDALVLPGGVMNPDRLRMNPRAVEFVRTFFEQHKPVSAICHAPWMLVEAGVVKDRRVTSWPSLRTDLLNAGASWTDEEVVTDQGLVTSRNPDDLPAFCRKTVEEVGEGRHERQTV